ncbi:MULTISPECIES: hypothetical protein [unclassified Streptomyces]|uniref:hypothetical protein n=1 Tax=unclassified Streptomyces TaxID=2593676 RepID=UPI00225423CD|nr:MULTISPECIES: hypothetical protein [unclassified Streptomyces]MCX5141298.1 hypothetical protein [Streptomyces sp. NBC_00338]WSU59828.1 hypothetical protein OG450_19150 [Streptomyces sp. NBC_01104]
MASEVWTSVLSLTGVALGGGLTALSQRATQRSADRAEERRLRAATGEARRAEQLQAIKEFIACAQAAERAAYRRPDAWGEDAGWNASAGADMTALWVAERHLVLLCPPDLHAAVQAYGRALNQAVWREIGDTEVNEHLDERKAAFMSAARAALSALSGQAP